GEPVALADESAVTRATGAPVGFAGPVGLGVRTLADASLRGMRGAVSGANRADEHVVNLDLERDVPDLAFADLRQARGGDRCPRCEGGTFAEHRGIEVGQVFLLGTKYSETMGATFLDAAGTQRPIEMGCYGIGITRTIAAAIEQHHDDAGIIWPTPLAPRGRWARGLARGPDFQPAALPPTPARQHPPPADLRPRRRDLRRGRSPGRAARQGRRRLQGGQAALPPFGPRGRAHDPPLRGGRVPRPQVPRHPAPRRALRRRAGAAS